MVDEYTPKINESLDNLYRIPLPLSVIENKRKEIILFIKDEFKSDLDYGKDITPELLSVITSCIDQAYLGGQLKKKVDEKNIIVSFHIQSDKETKIAGKCSWKKDNYKIQLNIVMMDKNIKSYGKLKTCGLIVTSLIECVMLTMEHEILHLIGAIGLIFGISNHNKKFKQYILNMFGHTSSRHEYNVDQEKLTNIKKEINIGDFIKSTLTGSIYQVIRMNQRTLGIIDTMGRQGRIGYNIVEKTSDKEIIILQQNKPDIQVNDTIQYIKTGEKYKVIKLNKKTVTAKKMDTGVVYRIGYGGVKKIDN